MKSDSSQKTLSRLIKVVAQTSDLTQRHQTINMVGNLVLAGGVVSGVVVLSFMGKLDPSTGVIMGSVLGYILGNKEK